MTITMLVLVLGAAILQAAFASESTTLEVTMACANCQHDVWVSGPNELLEPPGPPESYMHFGSAVSVSGDGKYVAVGAPKKNGQDGDLHDSGQVTVYCISADNRAWTSIGESIDGDAAYDLFGSSVSISQDGHTFAAGAPKHNSGGINNGQVKIYTLVQAVDGFQFSSWQQVGRDLVGVNNYDGFGAAVAISSDGTTVAIGAPNVEEVKVYTLIENDWVQVGDAITGHANGDDFGFSVSLAGSVANGSTRLAVGSPGSKVGYVQIYDLQKFVNGTMTWQLQAEVQGDQNYDDFGFSVAISGDGKAVAVGAPKHDIDGAGNDAGQIRVYDLQLLDNQLALNATQIGKDINGEAKYDRSGYSLSLSADGKTLAVGAPENDGNGAGSGHVRVYQYSEFTSKPDSGVQISFVEWIQMGPDLNGDQSYDDFGFSTSLAANGKTIAVGAPKNNSPKIDAGHVKIFNVNVTSSAPITTGPPSTAQPTTLRPSPSPSTAQPTTLRPSPSPSTAQPTAAWPSPSPSTAQPTAWPSPSPSTAQPTTWPSPSLSPSPPFTSENDPATTSSGKAEKSRDNSEAQPTATMAAYGFLGFAVVAAVASALVVKRSRRSDKEKFAIEQSESVVVPELPQRKQSSPFF